MMTLSYKLAPDFTLRDLVLEGLTGVERVANVKEALNVMRVQNPAVKFKADAQNGDYNDMPDEDYTRLLQSIKSVAYLFRLPGTPDNEPLQYDMNLLTLLVNALERVSQLDAEIRRLKGGR